MDQSQLVARLLDDFDTVRRDGVTRLVIVSAPPGWGKTYAIHRFYSRLAKERQGDSRYWPDEIRSGYGLISRKTTFPSNFVIPEGVTPSWIWWGAACSLTDGRRSLNVLRDNDRQIKLHIDGILTSLRRKHRNRRVVIDISSAVLSLLPLPDLVGATMSVKDLTEAVWVAARERASQRRAQRERAGRHVVFDDVDTDLVEEWAHTLSKVVTRDLPLVLFLEDAHAADPSTLALVESLIRLRTPVLVIGTTWPSELRGGTGGGRTSIQRIVQRIETADKRSSLSVIELRPPSSQSLADIVWRIAPSTSEQVVERLVRRSGGNPYVLHLILDTQAVRSQTRANSIDVSEADLASLPYHVTDLWERIWRDLDDPTRTVLALCALQGEEFLSIAVDHGLQALATAMHRHVSPSWDSLAWLLRLDDALYAFRERVHFDVAGNNLGHALGRELRAAKESLIDFAERALDDVSISLSPRARLIVMRSYLTWARSMDRVDPIKARDCAWSLADAALSTGEVTIALQYAESALDYSGTRLPTGLRLLVARLRLMMHRPGEAESVLWPLVSGPHGERDPWIDVTLAASKNQQGQFDAARQLLEPLVQRLSANNDRRSVAVEATRELGATYFWLGDIVRNRALIRKATAMNEAREAPDPYLRITLLRNLVPSENTVGNYRQAMELRKQILAARERMLGAWHPETIDARESYAKSLLIVGETGVGCRLIDEVLRQRAEVNGPTSSAVLYTRRVLFALQLLEGDTGAGLKLQQLAREAAASENLSPGQGIFDEWAILARRYTPGLAWAFRDLLLAEHLLGDDNPGVVGLRQDLILVV
jgi:hypothetical protein